jgi:hypothetical protein
VNHVAAAWRQLEQRGLGQRESSSKSENTTVGVGTVQSCQCGRNMWVLRGGSGDGSGGWIGDEMGGVVGEEVDVEEEEGDKGDKDDDDDDNDNNNNNDGW